MKFSRPVAFTLLLWSRECISQNPPCYVCFDGGQSTITLPDNIVPLPSFTGFEQATCEQIRMVAEDLLALNPTNCLFLDREDFRVTCGCENVLSSSTEAPVTTLQVVSQPAEQPQSAPVPVPVPQPITSSPVRPPVSLPAITFGPITQQPIVQPKPIEPPTAKSEQPVAVAPTQKQQSEQPVPSQSMPVLQPVSDPRTQPTTPPTKPITISPVRPPVSLPMTASPVTDQPVSQQPVVQQIPTEPPAAAPTEQPVSTQHQQQSEQLQPVSDPRTQPTTPPIAIPLVRPPTSLPVTASPTTDQPVIQPFMPVQQPIVQLIPTGSPVAAPTEQLAPTQYQQPSKQPAQVLRPVSGPLKQPSILPTKFQPTALPVPPPVLGEPSIRPMEKHTEQPMAQAQAASTAPLTQQPASPNTVRPSPIQVWPSAQPVGAQPGPTQQQPLPVQPVPNNAPAQKSTNAPTLQPIIGTVAANFTNATATSQQTETPIPPASPQPVPFSQPVVSLENETTARPSGTPGTRPPADGLPNSIAPTNNSTAAPTNNRKRTTNSTHAPSKFPSPQDTSEDGQILNQVPTNSDQTTATQTMQPSESRPQSDPKQITTFPPTTLDHFRSTVSSSLTSHRPPFFLVFLLAAWAL